MVELRFRCPEDVENTLIHHTKIKFMENVAAKLTDANVSRMSIIGTLKKCWEIGRSRESKCRGLWRGQVLSVPVVETDTGTHTGTSGTA